MLQKVSGDNCVALSKIPWWVKRFSRNSRDELNDDERCARSEVSNRAELVDEVHKIFAVGFGYYWIHLLVLEQLDEDPKIASIEYCKYIISTTEIDSDFLDSITTDNKTWCFKHEPETKHETAD